MSIYGDKNSTVSISKTNCKVSVTEIVGDVLHIIMHVQCDFKDLADCAVREFVHDEHIMEVIRYSITSMIPTPSICLVGYTVFRAVFALTYCSNSRNSVRTAFPCDIGTRDRNLKWESIYEIAYIGAENFPTGLMTTICTTLINTGMDIYIRAAYALLGYYCILDDMNITAYLKSIKANYIDSWQELNYAAEVLGVRDIIELRRKIPTLVA